MKLHKIEMPKEMLLKIYEKLPSEIIKERTTGNKKKDDRGQWVEEKLDYISSNTVIDILNDLFGEMGWNFEILNFWIEKGRDHKKKDYKSQEETVIPQGDIVHVHARLTATLYDENGNEYKVVKESFGSKSVIGGQSVQESLFKVAQSDALKKCASLLGIGSELYRRGEESIWFRNILIGRLFEGNKEVDELNNIINQYELDDETISEFVYSATNREYSSLNHMPSEYLTPLINEFKERIAAQEGE